MDRAKTLLCIIVEKEPPIDIVSAFILEALPHHVAEQVRLRHSEKLNLEGVVSCVKSLMVSATGKDIFMSTVSSTNSARRDLNRPIRYPSNLRCFSCNACGHIQRNCPILRDESHKRVSSENDSIEIHSGNGSAGVASMAFVTPEKRC